MNGKLDSMKRMFTVISITMFLFNKSLSQTSISVGHYVPAFQVQDANGRNLSDTLLIGKKTYLSFQRNVGCPICNLYVHGLLQKKEAFAQRGIEVVLVYESSLQNLQKYLEGEAYPFTFIADPQNHLYKKFMVEKSMGKVMKGMFHGLLGKVSKGNKLFKKKLKMDGDNTTIEAGFLVGPDKRLLKVHYGAFVGDQLTPDQIFDAFK